MLNMVEWAIKEGFIHEGANIEIEAFLKVRKKWYDCVFSLSGLDTKSRLLKKTDYEYEKEIANIKYGFDFDVVKSLYLRYRKEELAIEDYIKSMEEGTPV